MTDMNRAQRRAFASMSQNSKPESSAHKVHWSKFTHDTSDWCNPERLGKGEAEFIAALANEMDRKGIVVLREAAT